MKLNKKYSYNGYDPLSSVVKEEKAELNELFQDIESARIHLFQKLAALKEGLKIGKINHKTYLSRKAWFVEELRKVKILHNASNDRLIIMKGGFKNKSFLNTPVIEFNHTEIIGSDFSQLEPFTNVWNPQLTGVTFTNCNLNNCKINMNCTIINGSHEQIKEQNDGEYWIVNEELKPISPLHYKRYDVYELSKDPKDLPSKKLEESIFTIAKIENEKQSRKSRIIELSNNPTELQKIIDNGDLI